jgi:two-component system cell cycle sensor histidine kinase/response regulator CckA
MEAIGRLAGGVAHDFNNVLTAICGYNGMLLDRLQNQPELAGYAREVGAAADRAAALTNQLLTFSRRETPQAKLLSVNRVVLDMRTLLRGMIGEDIEIRTSLAPDLGQVRIDPVLLDQVIMNLAVNARDAMPDGGRLMFETANITVDAVTDANIPPGEYISLVVRDTGCGMDTETSRHLFEPFFTTKERGKGTGLGLSIVYGVMQQNGGSIAVESQPGAGTAFHLYLPRCPGPAQGIEHTQPAKAPTPAVQGITVLVVEDDKVILQFASAVLRQKGYRVLDAGTPAEAIGIAQENTGPIQLLLSDVLMPGMRGPALTARLRETLPRIPVLYMSGYSDSTFLDRSTLEEAVFLQKPFTADELLRVVCDTLARAEGVSPLRG